MALATWMASGRDYGTTSTVLNDWFNELAQSCYTEPPEAPKPQQPVTDFFPGLAITPAARMLKRIRQRKQRKERAK